MALRVIPEAAPPTGDETFFGIQLGKWRKFKLSMINLIPGPKGDKGDRGDIGPPGAPKRVERYSGVTNTSGIATFTFSPQFQAIPDVDVIEGWVGDQMVTGAILTRSTTGCTAQIMVSRGTLALSSGPFAKAGANVQVTVRAIGN